MNRRGGRGRDTDDVRQQNLEEFGLKIKRYRREAGMPAEELARRIGVSVGCIRNWECGTSRPDPSFLLRMFGILDVDPNTFFGIEGVREALAKEEKKLVRLYRGMDARYQTDYIALGETLLRQSNEWKMKEAAQEIRDNIVRIRDYGNFAAAGPGRDWTQETEEEEVYLYRNKTTAEADEVIRVSGDSMEPNFHDGDRVLVKYCKDAREGEVCIVRMRGMGCMIKVVGKDRLHSLNPDYKDIVPWDEDGVDLVGRVLGVIRPAMLAKKEEIDLYRESGMN